MTMIIDGTNGLTFNNSTVQASAGQVLQVVGATYATQVTNSTGTYADTGLTATITPKFSTSKILVCVNQNGVTKTTNDTAVDLQLLRTSTVLAKLGNYIGNTSSGATNSIGSVSIEYLDSPATTSATTYKTQFLSASGNASAVVQYAGGVTSTITLMEIAG